MKKVFNFIIDKIRLRTTGHIRQYLVLAYKYNKQHKNELSKTILKYHIALYIFGTFMERKKIKLLTKTVDVFLKDGYYEFYDLFKMPKLNEKMKYDLAFECCDFIFPMFNEGNLPTIEGTYEQFGITVNTDDVIIDAGANIGLFSIYSIAKGAAKAYAFEPMEENVKIIKKAITINSYEDRIIIVKKGLSNETGTANINISKDLSASSIVFNRKDSVSETINIITIDDFMAQNNIKKLDFIKADIEGAERLMLEGAQKTLKKHKPKLALCTYHLPDDKKVMTELILKANPDYEISYSSAKLFAK